MGHAFPLWQTYANICSSAILQSAWFRKVLESNLDDLILFELWEKEFFEEEVSFLSFWVEGCPRFLITDNAPPP